MIRTIDLFCGAGGSSFGARDAGAEIVAGFDKWKPAVKVFQANFPEAKLYSEDIQEINPEDVRIEIGDIDLILASPECKSHSRAKGSREISEESRNTAFNVVCFAEVFKPTWIVIENVEEIESWGRFGELIEELRNLGYLVNEKVTLNAMDFSVPQSRKRRFILCSLIATPETPASDMKNIRPASSIIKNGHYSFTKLRKEGRAETTIAKAENAIRHLGNDESFLIVYYGSGKNGKGGWQRQSDPLRTITTLDRFAYVVPGEDDHEMRMLQPEELKLAMGFRAEFKLDKVEGLTRRDRVKLMGNAVCPPVMEAIVKKLVHQSGEQEDF